MWTLGKPDQRSGDANEGFKSDGEFVIASSDTAELLKTCEESFDEISTFIDMLIIVSGFLSVRPGRYHRCGVHCFNAAQQAGGIERFIRNHGTDVLHATDEIPGLGDVMSLTSRQAETGEIAQAIDRCVNLGTQAPTRTSNTLLPVFFEAPAECWCARTMVLSRNTSSKSASSHSVANSVCQTPLSAQREKRLNTLFHGPNPGGRSRHGAPVRAIHSTASTNNRLSAPVRPRSPALPCSKGSIRFHWSLRRSSLAILKHTQKTGSKHIQTVVNTPLASYVHTP